MSGGSFEYAFGYVDRFADSLENMLEHSGEVRDAGFYEDDRYPEWDKGDTYLKLREIVRDCKRIAKLMKEVEWLYSWDNGEDSFLAIIAEIEEEFKE